MFTFLKKKAWLAGGKQGTRSGNQGALFSYLGAGEESSKLCPEFREEKILIG